MTNRQQLREIDERLERMEELLMQILGVENTERNIMSQVDDKIAALVADVTAETTVDQSAITLIQGIPAMITTAVNAAVAAGATPAQLQALTDLATGIQANSTALGDAVTAGTPHA